jgi:hypothetical protein
MVRVRFPPTLPNAIAGTVPGVLCVSLACPHLDASACHGFACRTAYMSPFAIALRIWYLAEQRTIKATVRLLLRQPYMVFLQVCHRLFFCVV